MWRSICQICRLTEIRISQSVLLGSTGSYSQFSMLHSDVITDSGGDLVCLLSYLGVLSFIVSFSVFAPSSAQSESEDMKKSV